MAETDTENSAWGRTNTPKVRSCLMCREAFESAWAGERICKKCKSQAQWRSASSDLPS